MRCERLQEGVSYSTVARRSVIESETSNFPVAFNEGGRSVSLCQQTKAIKPYVLIQKDDVKSYKWKEAGEELGFCVRVMPGSAVYVPLHLIRHMLKFGRPTAVIYRYLNDYRSFWKTLIRFATELTSVCICLLFGIEILWICHNVDRETNAHHVWLSNLRRRLFARVASKILVMDPLLVGHARAVFPSSREKIASTTFGPLAGLAAAGGTDSGLLEKVRDFVECSRRSGLESGSPVRIGLTVGTPHTKKPHFEEIPRLIEVAGSAGVTLAMIVIGPLSNYFATRDATVLNWLREHPRVLLIDDFVPVDETELAPYVDFYWRVSLDLSIPLAVYTAATSQKPILTRRPGFLSELVEYYQLGSVMSEDMSDIRDALKNLELWDPANAKKFLSSHTWRAGARAIGAAAKLVESQSSGFE